MIPTRIFNVHEPGIGLRIGGEGLSVAQHCINRRLKVPEILHVSTEDEKDQVESKIRNTTKKRRKTKTKWTYSMRRIVAASSVTLSPVAKPSGNMLVPGHT